MQLKMETKMSSDNVQFYTSCNYLFGLFVNKPIQQVPMIVSR